ncbi:helix-turn-helix domain-containing protein [Pseudonocardia sp. GCM10023141]|uniref:helix-turn-helix domain-containing protein n=1 Tax=Pseudonocardia sp. GCM10023141 TaxID=3252653 RepID=UPI0036202675
MRRRFDAAVGLAPEEYLRVARLHAVLGAARRAATPDWARIAAETGFYDQPHLLGEFRRTVGCSPDALIRAGDDRFLHDR